MVVPLLLHGKHAGPTVTYEPYGPWLVPWRIHSTEQEYQALRAGVGLIDHSRYAVIQVRGADRVDFLQRLLTNDVKRLGPGQGCQAALLDPSAHVLAIFLVLVDADSVWLLCDLHRAGVVAQTLDRYLFTEQVTVTNHERRWAVVALQGPRTLDAVASVVGAMPTLAQPEDHTTVMLQDIPVRLIRHSLIGDAGILGGPGVLCMMASEDALMAWEYFTRRGRPLGVLVVGWEALNIARIEAGLPWEGIDVDASNLLPETGLETVMASDTKGCYLGQEIVARLKTYGSVNKKLMGLVVDHGQAAPQAGDALQQEDDVVGRITSGCYSLALNRPIAMGYLKRGAYDPGTRVEIVCRDARLAATVAPRPPGSTDGNAEIP